MEEDMRPTIRVKKDFLRERRKELKMGDPGYDYSKLKTRTLMLLIADFTHAIDECEENGAARFQHEFPREVVESELSRMLNYLRENPK